MIITGHGEFDQVSKVNDCFNRAIDATRQKYLSTIFEDFYDDPVSYGNSTRWNPAGANTNSFSFIAGDEAGGSIIMSTGAIANSLVGLTPANSVGATPWTVATATPGKAFYLEAKFKITTTPDAATKAYVGFRDGTNSLLCGVFGPNSATAWAIQHSADEITNYVNFTGIGAVNTSYHTVRLWSTGLTADMFAQMDFDGAAPSNVMQFTPTVTYSKLRLWCRARNVGTAADQRLQLAYLFCATQP